MINFKKYSQELLKSSIIANLTSFNKTRDYTIETLSPLYHIMQVEGYPKGVAQELETLERVDLFDLMQEEKRWKER